MSAVTEELPKRRDLHFQAFDDIVADVEKLVNAPTVRTLGHWPLGQLISHLKTVIDSSIDGITVTAPWYKRLVGTFLKKHFLASKFPPGGFNLPKEVEPHAFPAVNSAREALEQLKASIARLKLERMTATHPIFGKLTHEEWTLVHLRHAELHLSFAVV